MESMAEVVIDGTAMRGKRTIHYQRLHFIVPGTTHDRKRCPHRVRDDTQICLWCALLRVRNCSPKIIDLTKPQCHRLANRRAMSIILKNQNVMTGSPQMGRYPQ